MLNKRVYAKQPGRGSPAPAPVLAPDPGAPGDTEMSGAALAPPAPDDLATLETSGAQEAAGDPDPDLVAALVERITESGDVRELYAHAGELAQLDRGSYAYARQEVKHRMGAAVSLPDLDKHVQEYRHGLRLIRARRPSSAQDAGEEGEEAGEAVEEAIPGGVLLGDSRYGALVYADTGEHCGVYVVSDRGRARCVLSARVDILRIHSSAARGRTSEIHAALTSPLWLDRPLTCLFTHEEAISGQVYGSSGAVGTIQTIPTSKADCELAYQAIQALAALAVVTRPDVRTQLVGALGWNGGGVWVCVNGYVDREAPHVGGAIAAAVPPDWPQTIPADPETLPAVVDASLIRRLCDFWPEDVTLFPLAMLGACAFTMRPYTAGTPQWELELSGNTGWLKTALINWLLRLFYGAGYVYDTKTQLSWGKPGAGDSARGHNETRARLPFHAYMTYDHSKKPGERDYEAQQEARLASVHATGDRQGGGAISDRTGGLHSRPDPRGLLIRQGEPDYYDYSIPAGALSDDARAVTFRIQGDSQPGSKARKAFSKELGRRARELDTIAILHRRWLASLACVPAEAAAQWDRICTAASQLVAQVEVSGEYPDIHQRTPEQCTDLAAGLISYCLFLRAVDADTGTFAPAIRGGAALAEEIKARIPVLIRERFAAMDALTRRYEATSGGRTPQDMEATAVCQAIAQEITSAEYITAQDSPLPSDTEPAPIEKAPIFLPRVGIGPKLLGWESVGVVYGTSTAQWQPKRSALPAGCEYREGRYIALDRTALDRIVREAAKRDKRIRYSTLAHLLANLHTAGAIEGGNEKKHPYTRQVRRPGAGRPPRMVCFPRERIWPELAGEDGSDDDTSDDEEKNTHTNTRYIYLDSAGTAGTAGTTQQYAEDETGIQADSRERLAGDIDSTVAPVASECVPTASLKVGTAQQYDTSASSSVVTVRPRWHDRDLEDGAI